MYESSPPASVGSPPSARLVVRLTTGFLVDEFRIGRNDRRPIDSLIILAIVQANIDHLVREDELQLAYADLDTPPPDELRRPVSVNALATSLRLPFETVRRRVRELQRAGLCRATPQGVLVPTEVLSSPLYFVPAMASYERLRRFYYELKAVGALHDLPAPAASVQGMVPVRAVGRLFGAYLLRTIDTVTRHVGDLLDALTLLAALHANIDYLPPDFVGDGPDEVFADDLRRPTPAVRLAARLGLPEETVRRHVARLIDQGLCVRVRRGVIVPAEVLAAPATRAVIAEQSANVRRLFVRLAQLGVLAVWDEVAPAAGQQLSVAAR